MYMGVLSMHMLVWYAQRPEKGLGSQETRIADSFRDWESSPQPLEGQPVLLAAESLGSSS